VCISEEFNASCPTDKIILVNLAEFGRMEVGRCIRKPDEFLGCANDVLPLLDNLCSGRQECRFEMTNDDQFEAANTNCLEILKKYLRIEYTCLKGKGHTISSN